MGQISARELYTFLDSKRQFADWIKDRIEKYGSIENQYFTRFAKKVEANNATMIQYSLNVDIAKEIAINAGNSSFS